MLWKLLILTLVICSPFATSQPVIPEGRLYNLKTVDIDVNQTVEAYHYVDGKSFRDIVYNTLVRRLDAAELLAAEDVDNPLDISIYVDYLRRFPGDATPFPATTQTAPEFFMEISVFDGGEKLYHKKSQKMTISGSPFNFSKAKEVNRDIGYLIALANTLIKELSDVIPDDALNTFSSPEESMVVAAEYQLKLSQKPVIRLAEYIPDEVIDGYIDQLNSDNQKQRIRAYQDIGRDWLYSKRLFSFIEAKIESTYLTAKSRAEIKEIREAMNALASSGLEEYRTLFKTIQASSADKKIVAQTLDSEKILTRRASQIQTVHDLTDANPQVSWRVNQYANILKLPNPKVRVWAVKKISQDYPKDEYLLALLAEILEREAFKSNYTTGHNSDFHAWICRVLGDSGNKSYLPLLQKVKSDASNEKVREFADEYSNRLEKMT